MLLHSEFPAKSIRFFDDCPCCGGKVTCPAPRDLTRLIELSEHEEVVHELLDQGAERAEHVTFNALFLAMFADDPNGGPNEATMRKAANIALNGLTKKAGAFGFSYHRKSGVGVLLQLEPYGTQEPAPRAPTGKNGTGRRFNPIPCPVCSRMVDKPTLAMVMQHCSLQPRERQILLAVDQGGSEGAVNDRLFAIMYSERDRPDHAKMYSALKVALSYMRGKLANSGATVANIGYGLGFRIVSRPGSIEFQP